jgi:hypothetical protein
LGFRRTVFKRNRRLLMKHARICERARSFRDRVQRLLDVLADPAPYIARFIARLRRGLCAWRLTPIAPPAFACADLTAPDAAFADSS